MPGPGQHGGFHRQPTPPPAPTFADKISEASHQLIGATAFPVAAGSVTPTQAAVVASLTALPRPSLFCWDRLTRWRHRSRPTMQR